MDKKALELACIEVLKANDRGTHTQPASGLYPHQWLWDSCFIAIGLRHVDVDRAKLEIESLLRGQWSNGMLPNMIFQPDDKYQRERNIWRSWVSPLSPDDVATSGITQPPMLAEAIWLVGQKLPASERLRWFRKLLVPLVNYHIWLYFERDPHEEGLTLQIHPYETGLDGTPPWLLQLHEHDRPWWISAIEWLKLDQFVNFLRRDTRYVPNEQRSSNIDALLQWNIIRRFRRKNWDINKILHRSTFCIEDITFNSILVRANRRLEQIAEVCRVKLPEELLARMQKSQRALQDLWDDQSGQYYSRDFISHQLIAVPSIGTMLPLYADGLPKERIERIVQLLTNKKSYWSAHPVPSVPLNSDLFQEQRYWQGPTWVNINWLIINGLRRHGHKELARQLTEKTLELVYKNGPSEYFSPLSGKPYGAKNFSWTAALVIDLLNTK